MDLNALSREDLVRLVQIYAKNWLAHDGCWFLAAEERLGIEAAIELDARAWERFSPVEANRIMEAFGIPQGGGLEALERALGLRLYASLNPQESRRTTQGAMRFRMLGCRVQQARMQKGLTPFPCKPVGLVEYAQFARTIDPRIETTCVHAPPDPIEGAFCEWEFRLARLSPRS